MGLRLLWKDEKSLSLSANDGSDAGCDRDSTGGLGFEGSCGFGGGSDLGAGSGLEGALGAASLLPEFSYLFFSFVRRPQHEIPNSRNMCKISTMQYVIHSLIHLCIH